MKKRGFSRKLKLLRIEVTSDKAVAKGNIQNVSPGGLGIRVHGKKSFKEGETVLLEAYSHGKCYQMEGIVIWVEASEPSSKLGVQLKCDHAGFCHAALDDTEKFTEPGSSLLRVIYLSTENAMNDWKNDVQYGRVNVYVLPPHPEVDTSVMVHFSLEGQKWEVSAKGLVTANHIDFFQVLLDNPQKLREDFEEALVDIKFKEE